MKETIVDVRIIDYPNTGGPSKYPPNVAGINPRVESGPVQFGEDWPGLFLRGDDAFALSIAIDKLVSVHSPTTDLELQLAVANLKDISDIIKGKVIGA